MNWVGSPDRLPLGRVGLATLLGFALAFLSPLGAGAQQPEKAGEAPIVPEMPFPPEGIEAIEVTGESMDAADVQDEAQAITAFDMADLDRANIMNVDGLGYNVPSLHVGQQGNQAIITLRGIGTQNASITGEPGVQFHVDGLNYARPAAARVAFFDLESVRVVRGPAGTNGGKNATGGAIHVTTRKPEHELGFEGDYQIGDYDENRARAAINLPLVPEVLAARGALIWEDHDGYQVNLTAPNASNRADDADNLGLRGHLRFNPSETFEGIFSYNYYQAKGVGPGAKLVGEEQQVRCLAPQSAFTEFKEIKRRRRPPVTPLIDKLLTPQDAIALGYLTEARANLIGFQSYTDRGGVLKTEQVTPFSDGTYYVRRFVNDRAQFTRHTEKAWCADLNSEYVSSHPPTEDPDDPRQVYLDMIQEQSNKIWGWGTTLNWDLPEAPLLGATRLTALGGFESTALSDPRDFDTTDLPFFSLTTVENDSDQYSGELRLESTEGTFVDWTTGLYYQRESSNILVDGLTFGSAFGLGIDQDALSKSYGIYGETKFHLSDALTLTTGARYTYDYKYTKLYRNQGSGFGSGGAPAEKICFDTAATNRYRLEVSSRGIPLAQAVPICEDRFRRWTGGIGLEWRPADDHLLYAQFDKGFKAGGYIVSDFGKYDPETVYAYTLGSKSDFLGGLLQLNFEGFYYKYLDYQVVEIDGISLRTENAPEARVFGAEVEFNSEPLPGLRLNGQGGYLNTEFIEYCSVDPMRVIESGLVREDLVTCESLPNTDQSGNQLARSPEWRYQIGVEYSFPIGAWGSLTPRVEYFWQDDTYYRAYNTAFDLQEAYHKTDVKLMWTSPEEMWNAEVFVRNIENEDVIQNLVVGSGAIGSPALAYYAPPRLYGFRVGFRY
jgi:iron complex outermembrane receptor protein